MTEQTSIGHYQKIPCGLANSTDKYIALVGKDKAFFWNFAILRFLLDVADCRWRSFHCGGIRWWMVTRVFGQWTVKTWELSCGQGLVYFQEVRICLLLFEKNRHDFERLQLLLQHTACYLSTCLRFQSMSSDVLNYVIWHMVKSGNLNLMLVESVAFNPFKLSVVALEHSSCATHLRKCTPQLETWTITFWQPKLH